MPAAAGTQASCGCRSSIPRGHCGPRQRSTGERAEPGRAAGGRRTQSMGGGSGPGLPRGERRRTHRGPGGAATRRDRRAAVGPRADLRRAGGGRPRARGSVAVAAGRSRDSLRRRVRTGRSTAPAAAPGADAPRLRRPRRGGRRRRARRAGRVWHRTRRRLGAGADRRAPRRHAGTSRHSQRSPPRRRASAAPRGRGSQRGSAPELARLRALHIRLYRRAKRDRGLPPERGGILLRGRSAVGRRAGYPHDRVRRAGVRRVRG